MTSRTLRNWTKQPEYRIAQAEAGALRKGEAQRVIANRMAALTHKAMDRLDELLNVRWAEMADSDRRQVVKMVLQWAENETDTTTVNRTLNVTQNIDWSEGAPPPVEADAIEVDVDDG